MTWELRDALVGNRQGLYQNNATFKASITVLAQLLPLMVDGIAADAEHHAAAMHERIAAAMHEVAMYERLGVVMHARTVSDRPETLLNPLRDS